MQFPNAYIQASTFLITSKTFTEVTEYGMNTEVAKRGDQHKWWIDFTTRLLNHRQARELSAFLDSLDGRYNTFTLPCPLPYLGKSTSFITDGTSYAGSDTIDVTGLLSNQSEVLVIGDYITFDNHDKVYKIKETIDSSVAGSGVMKIYPNLFTDVPAGTNINEGVFTLRMTKDSSGLSLSGNKQHLSIKISAKEA